MTARRPHINLERFDLPDDVKREIQANLRQQHYFASIEKLEAIASLSRRRGWLETASLVSLWAWALYAIILLIRR